jgi:hypothetical protein
MNTTDDGVIGRRNMWEITVIKKAPLLGEFTHIVKTHGENNIER